MNECPEPSARGQQFKDSMAGVRGILENIFGPLDTVGTLLILQGGEWAADYL